MINPTALLPLEADISWHFVHYLPVPKNLACVQPGTALLDLVTRTSLHVPAAPGAGHLPGQADLLLCKGHAAPSSGAYCLTCILLLHCAISEGKKMGQKTVIWELTRR